MHYTSRLFVLVNCHHGSWMIISHRFDHSSYDQLLGVFKLRKYILPNTQSKYTKFSYSPGYHEDNSYWVGATDRRIEGDFQWTDLLPFTYT
ncbi:unnamed protein product, partial [Nesidiocoris tenuis]